MSTEKYLVPVGVCVGLLIAPLAWAVSTQLGQILPYLDCQHQARFSAIASFAGALCACMAGAISWRSASCASRLEPQPALAFMGSVSALSASVFAFALSMQGIASVVLSGCER
jgi:hypothetical protein